MYATMYAQGGPVSFRTPLHAAIAPESPRGISFPPNSLGELAVKKSRSGQARPIAACHLNMTEPPKRRHVSSLEA